MDQPKALEMLHGLFARLPETTGCERCREVNGDNEQWCCRNNSPSMYRIEFLNVWAETEPWDKEKRKRLLFRAIRNFLSSEFNKPCVFWEDGCTVYGSRPLACRNYGIIPKKSWHEHNESLKKKLGNDFPLQKQCDMVSVLDGELITDQKMNNWFDTTRFAERILGIADRFINLHDEEGGTYRTFHDHIMMSEENKDFAEVLVQLKLKQPTSEQIDAFLKTLDGMM